MKMVSTTFSSRDFIPSCLSVCRDLIMPLPVHDFENVFCPNYSDDSVIHVSSDSDRYFELIEGEGYCYEGIPFTQGDK